MSERDEGGSQGESRPGTPLKTRQPGDVPGKPKPKDLVPVLVEQPGDGFGVVWLDTPRSEIACGTVFTANARRWVITGQNPSGVTFTCREVTDEKSG
jgi:hypothetical protein